MNTKNKSSFEESNSKASSAIKLFENTSIFKSLTKVVFLAIVVSLATGIYIFADQILMVKIIPLNTKYFSEELIWSSDMNKIHEIINKLHFQDGVSPIKTDVASLVRTSVSLSSPLTLICSAITLMLGLGISINYSKALGKKDYVHAKNVWNNGFYLVLIVSIATSIILMALTFAVIPLQSKQTNLEDILDKNQLDILNQNNEKDILQNFLNESRDITIDWGIKYSLITIGFNILNCYTMLFISLLNSEGKNGIPTIFILVANVLNIGLDVVLLYFTDLGIMGAAIATVISWCLSTSIFVFYIRHLNKKDLTVLNYNDLKIKNVKLDKTIIFVIFAIGISSFARNAATSLFSLTQQSIYGNITSNVTTLDNTYYLTILGAVNPIYNLFYSAIVGIIRGARTVITYNYAKNHFENVRKAYWLSIGMAFFYSTIFFILVCFALRQPLFWLFNITSSDHNFNDASKVLFITMTQLPLFCLTISGMLYFQATSKPIRALITSITNAIFFGIPGLFIAGEIAKATSNMDFFIYSPIAIYGFSGILIFLYSSWTVSIKKEDEKKYLLNQQKNALLEQ